MDFLFHCAEERILVLIYPPHSTHTLQPLDVVCFSPLATNYSTVLANHLHGSQGLMPFKKGDFFRIFWQAWTQTFTEKLVLRSFEAVGIAPLNPNVILNRFTPSQAEAAAARAFNEAGDWRHNDNVWRQSVKDPAADEAKELRQTLHQLTNQNELLKMERDGLQEVLSHARSKPTKSKSLPFIQPKETRSKTQWYSLRGVNEAQHLQNIFEQEERDDELHKHTERELRESNRKLKQKLDTKKKAAAATRRKEAAERARLKREEVAKRKAERERQKQERDAAEAIQLPQRGKRKVSQSPAPRKKQNRGAAAARSRRVATARSPTLPPTYNNRDRKIAPRKKFEPGS
ncbi:DDE 1 domain containing protein [Pyrenophora teres f. teres]|uniref:DDE 1 domain containing protein n=1 Tax=Pyrenophora teres f. teres TaxID=97479 RepID=A0A6S6W1P8_9PLEO|nr:DDE 1 domain containing protein [Pyrenophora teres f. teres]